MQNFPSTYNYLNEADQTCEPVLTEAASFVKRGGHDVGLLLALLERGVIRVALQIQDELADPRALMHASLSQLADVVGGCVFGPFPSGAELSVSERWLEASMLVEKARRLELE